MVEGHDGSLAAEEAVVEGAGAAAVEGVAAGEDGERGRAEGTGALGAPEERARFRLTSRDMMGTPVIAITEAGG